MKLHKYDDAIACFDIVIKINPQYVGAYYNKGFVLAEINKHEEAIKCFDIAIGIDCILNI